MPAKNPRVNVVLEETLYKSVRMIAERDGVSMSTKSRDLIKEALEIQEDIALLQIVEDRDSTLDNNTLSHDDVWS